MKSCAVLVVETTDGELVAHVDASVVPLMNMAKAIRIAGRLDDHQVACGMVITSQRGCVRRFRCERAAVELSKGRKTKG
jgi:hypothetical protein